MTEKEEATGGEQDDVSFLRTGDIVALTCVVSTTKDGVSESERVCLSTEGFGNRRCTLENVSRRDCPPDISMCMLYIDNALSVRALQEMMSADNEGKSNATSAGGSSGAHKTLLYGHAVQLRHVQSEMYLACLASCSSNDKLAFDVGVQESSEGESSWWTIHPASKQRSEGEKVRAGDDVILVSVATERYLHMSNLTDSRLTTDSSRSSGGTNDSYIVIASFHQTLWNVASVSSGSVRIRNMGYLFGNDVLRLYHGNDECLTIAENWSDEPAYNLVIYEGGSAVTQARSLWRVEPIRAKWHGALVGFEQPFRIRHITTGRFLAVVDSGSLVAAAEKFVQLVHRDSATYANTAFTVCATKDAKRQTLDQEKEDEGMGVATLRYGETNAFIRHVGKDLWLTYHTSEVTKKGLGKVEEKKAIAHSEGHMDDCYTFFMALGEESKSARVIRKCSSVLNRFLKGVEGLQTEGVESATWQKVNLHELLKLMEDLCEYFAQPDDELEFELRQDRLRALRSRQDLFQAEGVLNMIIDTIDKFSAIESLPNFASLVGESDVEVWEDISTYLYLLVAAMIKGNHSNCAQFASLQRLDWLFSRLSNPQSAEGILDVLYCVLTESPEALNMIGEAHIRSVIGLLEKVGRDPKVLDVLSSLCEGNGMAVRSSQNTITEHLLPGRDLLLQTAMRDHVSNMMPNILVGLVDGCALFKRWYFEAEVEHLEKLTKYPAFLRVGWANTTGFRPFPGSGDGWGCMAAGDDFYSYGFDGRQVFFAGKGRPIGNNIFRKGDIIGCALDLVAPEIRFTLNGQALPCVFRNFNTDGLFFPVMSLSARVSCRFLFGHNHGRLQYGPPAGFAPILEALSAPLTVEECLSFGELGRQIYAGPSTTLHHAQPFVPQPVDISAVALPLFAQEIQSKYAENLHELWAMKKIDLGWIWGEVRSEGTKRHPCLAAFDQLPHSEQEYNMSLSAETMKSIVALGYHMLQDKPPTRLRPLRLPQTYQQQNGYRPQPLDTHEIMLPDSIAPLIEALAKNTHNVWAREKIRRGWTFGLNDVVDAVEKRTPHLVPYEQVDERIKEANREAAAENIRALQLFGIFLETPVLEHDAQVEKEMQATSAMTRTYRAEASYRVATGKWYYEFEVLTDGWARIGWMDVSAPPETKLGSDDRSYGFDGYLAKKWHQGAETYGRQWRMHDVVGCFIDLNDRTISFSLNGELLLDTSGSEMAFDNVCPAEGFVPAMTLSAGQRGHFNFGHDSNSLRYFTTCGLQEGYEPFCVNMFRQMPFWYAKRLPSFAEIDDESRLDVTRVPASAMNPPCLKLTQKLIGAEAGGGVEKARIEYIRLSLPIKCPPLFARKDKDALARQLDEAQRRGAAAARTLQQLDDQSSLGDRQGALRGTGKSNKGKLFLSAFRAQHDSRAGADDDQMGHPSKSKGSSFDSSFNDVLVDPPAVTQRRRVLTLMNFGLYSFDEQILAWLSADGENADTFWLEHARKSNLLNLTSEERLDAMERLKHMTQSGGGGRSGVDTSPRSGMRKSATATGATTNTTGGGILGRIRRERQRKQEDRLSQAESKRLKMEAGIDVDPATGQQRAMRTGGGYDSMSASAIEGSRMSSRHASKDMLDDMPVSGPGRIPTIRRGSVKRGKKRPGERGSAGGSGGVQFSTEPRNSLISSPVEAELLAQQQEEDFYAMTELGNHVDEYYYGVRIFPGQDPASVWVGWVTPHYHSYHSAKDFNINTAIRKCRWNEIDHLGMTAESVEYRNCYMLNAMDLLNAVTDSTNTKVSGLLLGCLIDTSVGELSFMAAGQDTGMKFKLEPGAMLYPAVFFQPTSNEVLQFELGRSRYTFPLSAAMFKSSSKQLTPYCPPRLSAERLQPVYWARVPNQCLRTAALKLSDVRGWSVLCDDAVQALMLYIPECDTSIDILELVEKPALLNFHSQTLELYCKLAAYGNQRVAHTLCGHVDETQLMYAVKSQYLSGPMRQGFYNLLIAVHLKTHADARLSTAHEYILPLVRQLAEGRNVFDLASESRYPQLLGSAASILPVLQSEPIRHDVMKEEIKAGGGTGGASDPPPAQSRLLPPAINYSVLKEEVMLSLKMVTHNAVMCCRDFIGGDSLNHFEPLLKLFDTLFVIGLVSDDDIIALLCLLHPVAFDEQFSPNSKNKPPTHAATTGKKPTTGKGLAEIPLAERVKIQLVRILEHLCDVQLRHRIESLIAFAAKFVRELQKDQCRRYMEIKQTDMPPSEAARRTKEFRCPPKEQMFRLLAFKQGQDVEPSGMALDSFDDAAAVGGADATEQQLDQCPTAESLQEQLRDFCSAIVTKLARNSGEGGAKKDDGKGKKKSAMMAGVEDEEEWSWVDALAHMIIHVPPAPKRYDDSLERRGSENFRQMIVTTLKRWADESEIESSELIRGMFHLLLRQYSGVKELMDAMAQTYVLHERNIADVENFIVYLMQIRELLNVQLESNEEAILKRGLWQLMNNRIFFQHPDLMRLLRVHEDVMRIMVNVLTAQQSAMELIDQSSALEQRGASNASEMVVACSRFLCYFCRTSRMNQKAMFEHLSFLLDNATMLLARPSLRGSVPLDVAYSSFMDNNELALALKEEELDKVAVYLSRCGLQANSELLAKDYPDIGWDPVEGERYLDFLRFCVWINGENVEENANLVIRLLIRRPECLGVALKGEGQGLYVAFNDAIALSQDIKSLEEGEQTELLLSNLLRDNPKYPSKETEGEDYVDLGAAILDFYASLVDLLAKCAPDPQTIQAGKGDSLRARAILRSLISMEDLQRILALRFKIPNFNCFEGQWAVLNDESRGRKRSVVMTVLSNMSKTSASSLTTLENLTTANSTPTPAPSQRRRKSGFVEQAFVDATNTLAGIVGMASAMQIEADESRLSSPPFLTPPSSPNQATRNTITPRFTRVILNKNDESVPGLQPNHKQSILLFLDRVYGIDTQEMLFQFLEQSFLLDLRAATMMDSPRALESDMALALNRYLCNAVLPLLTSHSHFFADAEHQTALLDATLHTVYRMNHLRSLTKNQREAVSDFLVALTRELPPAMMIKLLRKVILDIEHPTASENVLVPLRIVTLHYERCNKYYANGNAFGVASETEKRLSMLLFYAIFDSLGARPYDPELFGKALPCLTAIGSAISPEYALTSAGSERQEMAKTQEGEGVWIPRPVDDSKIGLPNEIQPMKVKFAEHFHNSWSARKLEKGWIHGELYSRRYLTHPRLLPYSILRDYEKDYYMERCAECLRALIVWGYAFELVDHEAKERADASQVSSLNPKGDFHPRPIDLSNMTLQKEMMSLAERLAENSHNISAKKIYQDMANNEAAQVPLSLVPWDLLTDLERSKDRFRAHEILRFFHYHGYRIHNPLESDASSVEKRKVIEGERASVEKRFAYNLLEKLLQYLEQASFRMKSLKPSQELTRRNSFKAEGQDVKFFEKVVLPLILAYFNAHKHYFLAASSMAALQTGIASNKEKEMVATLFCRLAALLRIKNHAFGSVAKLTVKCLQALTQALDLRTLVKINSDIVRTGLLTFFNNSADDLLIAVQQLQASGQYALIRGEHLRSWLSMKFADQSTVPVLASMFMHIARNHFGQDLLLDDIQAACYKILDSLYLVTSGLATAFADRQSVRYEVDKHRPGLGQCLSAFASCFPVAFLEPEFNVNNRMSVLAKSQDQSVQVQEMLQNLSQHVPKLEKLLIDIEQSSQTPSNYADTPNVYDVDLPLLCSYLTYWWPYGPDGGAAATMTNRHGMMSSPLVTQVTSQHINRVFCALLRMMRDHIGRETASWLCRVNFFAVQIIPHVTCDPVREHLLPLAEQIRRLAEKAYKEEEHMRSHPDVADEGTVVEDNTRLVRDVYAFFPVLMKYTDLHRAKWLKSPGWETDGVYENVAVIFRIWSLSQHFKREELNYMAQFDEDDGLGTTGGDVKTGKAAIAERKKKRREGGGSKNKQGDSVVIACFKRLLPVGLNVFGGRELDIVQQTKEKFLAKESEEKIRDFVRQLLDVPVRSDPTDSNAWQLALYRKIGKEAMRGRAEMSKEGVVDKIFNMGQVVAILHTVTSRLEKEDRWKKVLTLQRKRMAISLITASHLYKVDTHRGINFFLSAFSEKWLTDENVGQDSIVVDLCTGTKELTPPRALEDSKTKIAPDDAGDSEEKDTAYSCKPDALRQLVQCFQRAATSEESKSNKNSVAIADDQLFNDYALVMAKSIHIDDGDDDDEGGSGGGADDKEMDQAEKEEQSQLLRAEQAVLADRGVAIMCLMYLSASGGEPSEMVANTLQLGIHLLSGGNKDIQKMLISYLQTKKDVRFFTSMAGLMARCSVLNLEMFERQIKAEGLGMGAELAAGEHQNLNDAEFTCSLFRFIQLTCEGHYLDFQNYLRTQPGHTTSVNLINATVDYLLRLQESVMDFYWHYSSKEVIDEGGKEYFLRAIQVIQQVFNTLTESIQGPCVGNQMTLANSRLWDAINGFFFLFAHMMEKLYKNSTQLELLREFLNLQKDMIVLMLSMLEGNVLNGPIGKQMVDALVESQPCVEMILKFSDMFLKLKDLTTSQAFQDFDTNRDGWISPKEFQRAMEAQKMYSQEEITYLMMCTDVNNDGKVDYLEFTERFHNPARDIGFNLAVLLTNLKEHITSDPRLEKILEKASSLLEYFDKYLGRIEIMGSSKRVEKIYFEIQESWLEQWGKQQIRDSKNGFLFNVLQDDGGDHGKLEAFINFCEDTIFEMQHAAEISSGDSSDSKMERAMRQRDYFLQQTTAGEHISKTLKASYECGVSAANALRPENVKKSAAAAWLKFHSMTWRQLIAELVKLHFRVGKSFARMVYFVLLTLAYFIWNLMNPPDDEFEHGGGKNGHKGGKGQEKEANRPQYVFRDFRHRQVDVFGMQFHTEQQQAGVMPSGDLYSGASPQVHVSQADRAEAQPAGGDADRPASANPDDGFLRPPPGDGEDSQRRASTYSYTSEQNYARAQQQIRQIIEAPPYLREDQVYEPKIAEQLHTHSKGSILNVLARNFKSIEKITLYLAFFINVILLFHRVDIAHTEHTPPNQLGATTASAIKAPESEGEAEDDETVESVYITGMTLPYFNYTVTGWLLAQVLYWLSVGHAVASTALLVSFYQLKIPLITFKREKEVARRLMFAGCWITDEEDAEERGVADTLFWYLDRIVISAKSFPMKYWDKFVRRKTKQKYREQVDEATLNALLGEERAPGDTSFDYRYSCWLWFGVILTNAQFLYRVCYLLCSVLGVLISPFFYAFLLIDVVLSFPMLKAILQSVTHNLQQLILTIMMTLVVVYLYTVLGFNFFRKFYVQEEEGGGEPDRKCHYMLTCFIYHFYAGVRAGGGIGDEIESPYGDDLEYARMLYDISFFFFVIVILLAIMQGLIIDAFGELRDQQESATEKLESSCFICDIGKETFDRLPRGFEIHTTKEHNFANYLFFLQHLVNKDETEYTGQETYVREKYDNRDWEFFPVGECFMKQYEDQLLPSS